MNKRFELTTAELNSESDSFVFMDSTSAIVWRGNTAPSGTMNSGTPSFCFRMLVSILVWTFWVSFTSSKSFTIWENICSPIPSALELLILVLVGRLCLGVSVGLQIRVVGQLCLGIPVGVLAFGVTRLGVGRLDLQMSVDCLSRLGNPLGLGVLLGLGVPIHNFIFQEVKFSVYS